MCQDGSAEFISASYILWYSLQRTLSRMKIPAETEIPNDFIYGIHHGNSNNFCNSP